MLEEEEEINPETTLAGVELSESGVLNSIITGMSRMLVEVTSSYLFPLYGG